ncbi:oxidoreductase [Mycena capillaripes]|nr:oxidoreductase [Mycena capillaripes]
MFFAKDWNPDGLHCYVTGGSTGLGLELAKLLTQKGAHVSIVARNQQRLDKALSELEAARKYPAQQLHAYSFSLYNAVDSAAALQAACAPHDGKSPDAVFTCAGAARPMYFVEMTEEDLRRGMDDAYWVQAWTIFAAVKQMVRQKRKGRLALVSSTVGYMSFLGWASYAPGKQALRGLADTLQSELMLYPDISVHIYFPGSILTPGFEEEQRSKPKITKEIDDADSAVTPDVAARAFFTGVQKGHAHITSDFITDLFRASTRGVTPKQNWFKDAVWDMLAYFVAPIWRSGVDRRVRASGPEHIAHLQKQGFFDSTSALSS